MRDNISLSRHQLTAQLRRSNYFK